MDFICDVEVCTGCLACFNVCKRDAIEVVNDEEGFYRPTINHEKCINCNLCKKICPQNNKLETYLDFKKVYAAWTKSRGIRKNSTSGGIFTELANRVIELGGIVYGAGFDSDFNIEHKCVSTVDELKELQGSKYVQSYVGYTYRNVKKQIDNNQIVLFSGTPCQIDALYAFLGKRYEGYLYTIDLVCHGVPSPKVYRTYLEHMKTKYRSDISEIKFREKEPGWKVFGMKIQFKNKKIYRADTNRDPFIRGFLREYYLRPSCHVCKYATIKRPADITLADFWGYVETNRKDRDCDKGISMVMINNRNGEFLFNKIKNNIICFDRSLDEAVKGNRALSRCFPPSPKREEFWRDYKDIQFDELEKKYLYPELNPWLPKINKKLHRRQDIDLLIHLPNHILKKILGKGRYEKLKDILKGSR